MSNLSPHKNQPLVLAEATMDSPILYNIAGGEVCLFSSRSPDKDTVNEDASAVIPIDDNSGLLVVADGVGGSRGGSQAALLAVEAISESVEKLKGDIAQLRSAILDGIELANERILNLSIGASTTLALLEINNGRIRPYHIGDSLILAVGSKGKVKLNPAEHSPTGYAILAGLLDNEDALVHDSRHVVSNVVGDCDMRIEIGPMTTFACRDTVLIASDGLSDNLRLIEIVDAIRKGSLTEAGEALVSLSHQRMEQQQEGNPSKPDDLTFILYRKN